MRQAILNCHFNRSIETFQPSLHNRKALSVAERKGDWLLLAGLDFLSPIRIKRRVAVAPVRFASAIGATETALLNKRIVSHYSESRPSVPLSVHPNKRRSFERFLMSRSSGRPTANRYIYINNTLWRLIIPRAVGYRTLSLITLKISWNKVVQHWTKLNRLPAAALRSFRIEMPMMAKRRSHRKGPVIEVMAVAKN